MSKSLLKAIWLFAVVIAIMMAGGLPLWLLAPLLVVLLAAPLIREFSGHSDLDERQRYISHLSSHIALYVIIGLILFVMVYESISHHEPPEPALFMILIIPLVIKFIISLFENYGATRASQLIAGFFAAAWILFVLLSHGFTLTMLIESLPFLLILLVVLLIRKKPLWAGLALIVLAAALTVIFRAWMRFDLYVRLLMYTLIPIPLIISGVALLWNTKSGGKIT